MAAQGRLECVQFKQGQGGKVFAHRLGSAYEKDGRINVYLDSMPLQDVDKDGKLRLSFVIQPPYQKPGAGGPSQPQAQAPMAPMGGSGEEIPF